MNWSGLILGTVCFLLIGLGHPLVIKSEYYWGKKVWPGFLVGGLAFMAASLFVHDAVLSALLGVAGCTLLWGIGELFEQEKRVEKGWFPANPKKKR